MKNMKKYISLLFLLTFFGCGEDFLSKSPEQSVDTDLALGDIDNIEVAVNGIYNGLQDADYYGRYFIVIFDVMGDHVKQSVQNSNRLTLQYQYNQNSNSADAREMWEDAYAVINRANNVIIATESLEDPDNTTRINQARAEALTLRALAHWDLVRYFAQPYNASNPSIAPGANGSGGHLGVPVVTELLLPESVPPRNTVAEVYTQVIADLTAAIPLFDDGSFSRTKMTAGAARAILSKVYLYMEDWGNAEATASQVLGDANYTELTAADFVGSWNTLSSTNDRIFEVAFTNAEQNGTNALGYIYSQNGYYDMLPTTDLDNLVAAVSDPANDVRAQLWDTSVPVATKYKGPDHPGGYEFTCVLRLADIRLVRAEARAEQGDFANARTDLDFIRSRRGIANSAATNGELVDAIIDERAIELAFEGSRLFDLVRKGKGVTRNDCILPNGCTISFPDARFAQPIPQVEMDINPNMVQNTGY
jgi:hypothetical protein